MNHAPRLAILWDNDGVLVDTEPLYFEANRRVLLDFGVELDDASFARLSLIEGRSVLELARERGADGAALDTALARRDRIYDELLAREAAEIDGARDTLAALRPHARMGIVTSSRRDHFTTIHARTRLLPLIDFHLAREDYGRAKPHPEPYLTAVARFGLDPQATVVVEDTERGLQAALAAGLRCLAIPRGLSARGRFDGAAAVLGSVRDVPAWLAAEGLLG